MWTLLAFVYDVAAFALVAALAVEFVFIRSVADPTTKRRIIAADAVLGPPLVRSLSMGCCGSFFEKGAADC